MVKEIKVNSKKYPNLSIIVDDEDYEYLNQFKWAIQPASKTYYAVRTNPYGEEGLIAIEKFSKENGLW